MADDFGDLPEGFRRELQTLGVIAAALGPLPPARRARVLLLAVLTAGPSELTDAQLRTLVELGREPEPSNVTPIR